MDPLSGLAIPEPSGTASVALVFVYMVPDSPEPPTAQRAFAIWQQLLEKHAMPGVFTVQHCQCIPQRRGPQQESAWLFFTVFRSSTTVSRVAQVCDDLAQLLGADGSFAQRVLALAPGAEVVPYDHDLPGVVVDVSRRIEKVVGSFGDLHPSCSSCGDVDAVWTAFHELFPLARNFTARDRRLCRRSVYETCFCVFYYYSVFGFVLLAQGAQPAVVAVSLCGAVVAVVLALAGGWIFTGNIVDAVGGVGVLSFSSVTRCLLVAVVTVCVARTVLSLVSVD